MASRSVPIRRPLDRYFTGEHTAIEAVVRFARRYVAGRELPKSTIDLIDEIKGPLRPMMEELGIWEPSHRVLAAD